MSSLYLMRSHLCRGLKPQPWHIIKRYKFSGRRSAITYLDEDILPLTPARTRFAPSPTGYMHLGSLRTALYNYLLAKATGGQFLLRIEDTDRTRIVPDAETRLYDDLKWAGLNWDEGPDIGGFYGPYRQSERLKHYAEHAKQLLDRGLAYRCFCRPPELDQQKALDLQNNVTPRYNGRCASITLAESDRRAQNGEPHCVRFKCNDQLPGITDLVYKYYKRPALEEDFVIMKRDEYPTYHFANVIDDHLMDITHVIRGAEWLISTPKHVALYEAFGWSPPKFAHVGLLVDNKGNKLSKRNGDVDISTWRDRGILPVALLNYLMLLGWSHGRSEKGHSEVMDLNDMITKFRINFTKGNIQVNDKHDHFQKVHMMRGAGKNEDYFEENIYPSLDRTVRLCEKDRLASPGGAGFVSRLSGRLGPLVPSARLPSNKKNPDPDTNPVEVYREYLRGMYMIDSKSYKKPIEYLIRSKYLLWEVPESIYEESLETLLKNNIEFFIVKGERRDVMKARAEGKKIEEKYRAKSKITVKGRDDSLKEIQDLPHGILVVLDGLRDAMKAIDPNSWCKGGLKQHVTPYIETVFSLYIQNNVRPWGFQLLRWVINASQAGPAALPFMKLLGRDETMRRMDLAYKAACTVLERRKYLQKFAVDVNIDFEPPFLTQEPRLAKEA
ncbi:hypothetical protein F4810DRAFT_24506 [Camillea tinctor]|nr:hypothetical protein F4810DRAFT_24506 [Camillea tinctor]